MLRLPVVELLHGEEDVLFIPAGDADDGGDELLEEVQLQQRRPEVLDEVDHETLDVGTVEILIRHDHQMTVSQGRRVLVHHVESESEWKRARSL